MAVWLTRIAVLPFVLVAATALVSLMILELLRCFTEGEDDGYGPGRILDGPWNA